MKKKKLTAIKQGGSHPRDWSAMKKKLDREAHPPWK
jgi:hypothetical protein